MSVLTPLDWIDKVNSPDLLAFLQQFGEEHYLSAEEINELRDFINELLRRSNLLISPDALISSVPPTKVGNVVTYAAGQYTARINQNIVTNILFETTITSAADGYHRTDLIEIHADGTIHKIEGDESIDAAFKPNKSDNAVEINTINIFGAVISEPSEPYDDSQLLQKGGYTGTAKDLDNKKQDISNQISVDLPTSVQNSWHGKTVKFTTSGLLTIPASFTNSGMTFEGITKAGVTLSWAITTPKTFEFGTPGSVTEKQIFTFMQNDGLNSIMILGV